MPEPKAQLVDPQGPIDVPGMQVTGVTTATGGFVGQVQGAATGFAATTYNISVGVVTSTGFVGDVTGTASSVTKGANLSLGIVTASSFAGDVFGNAAGLSTTTAGLKLGIVSATSFAGNFTGIGSGITGTPNIQAGIMTATSFAGNFTGLASGITGTPNLMVGILTGTAYSGDGSALTGIAATNWITNNVAANSGTTTVNLSLGNVVKFTQTSNTTVSFANTGTSNIVTLIRPGADYTITWPDTVKWNGGSTPTLNGTVSAESQVFTLLSRDEGVTWYGWETVKNTFDEKYALWAWGKNTTAGTLGLNEGTLKGYSSPTQIPGSTWTTTISGNYGATFAKKSDGSLWAWGNNASGLLGQNQAPANPTNRSSPIQIGSDTTWDKFPLYSMGDADSNGAAMMKTDGTLWVWGNNGSGLLGLNQDGSGSLRYSSPVQLPGTNWRSFDMGATTFIATKTDGTLWTWGEVGAYGNLGHNQRVSDSAGLSSPTQVGSGTDWSEEICMMKYGGAAIKTDGTLWIWGYNYYGQLGVNSAAGSVYGISSPVQVPGTDWEKVSRSINSTYAIKTNGQLWGWGDNEVGEIALPTMGAARSSPVQLPGTDWSRVWASKTYAPRGLRTDGTLWAWGYNAWGSMGNNNNTNTATITQVPGTWKGMWAGGNYRTYGVREP